jgi:hypothetical protein
MTRLTKAGAVLALIAVLSSCTDTINVRSEGGQLPSGLTIQATGEAKVVPDSVRLNLTVMSVSTENETALNEVSSAAEEVRAALKENGIDEQDISTQSVSVSPEYSYDNNRQVLIGYRAVQSFDILIEDAENAGKIVDAVVAAGGSKVSVNSTYPVVVDTEKSLQEARKDAVEKARAKAEEYAELLGVELGEVVYMNETPNYSVGPVMSRADGAVSEKAETVIDLGTQNVTVSLEIRWEFK